VIVLNHWRTVAAFIGVVAVGVALYLAVSATGDVRANARKLCQDTNRLRENQASGLEFQIRSTEVSLRGDLGELEPFRVQIVEQHERRKRQLAGLREAARDHPMFDGRGRLMPYTVNCNHLFG
jgi:hypothetical protein